MQQQTGVPPIIRQQAQPAFIHATMQSQHAWIIASHALSPLVQVTQQPSLVISHLQTPIVMLQQHTVMPFMVQQNEHMPPAIIWQRFCIIAQAVGSSQMQVTFIPPAHFSIFIVQRGTMTMFGAIAGIPVVPMLGVVGMPVAVIGFIIAVIMARLLWLTAIWPC